MFLKKFHFARRLLDWYDRNRRELPWRAARGAQPNPYHVLVSELMLQQTQVATVIPYFNRFISRWPDVAALAAADEQEVLRGWQGLGYYSRARNLLAAAKRIAAEHGGRVPSDVQSLHALPGIGRYTAGAVASIGFDVAAPIVDGNVARVLCRLDCISSDPREPATQQHLWKRAEQILPAQRLGDFNAAMMELGATVCTPRSPQCLICPVQKHCEAFAAGMHEQIPPPRKASPTPLLLRQTFCIRRRSDGMDQWLIQQRPPSGRWAGMWQFITIEARSTSPAPTAAAVRAATTLRVSAPRHLTLIEHALTHRRYRFDVYTCDAKTPFDAPPAATMRWAGLSDLEAYPLPRPQVKILSLLKEPLPAAAAQR